MPPTTENPSETGTQSPPVSLPALHHDRDIPCPNCRYNLRNLTSANCPECGQEITIDRLFRPAPRFDYAWLITWTFAALCAEFSFNFWHHFLRYPRSHYVYIPGQPLGTLLGVYMLSWFPAAIFLLIFRRRFSRLHPLIRWPIAATLAVLILTDLYHSLRSYF